MAIAFLKLSSNRLFKTADTLEKNATQSRKISKNIGKTLEGQSLFKKQSIAKKENIYQKRKDGIRRRNQRDLFEASKSTNTVQKIGKVVSNSSKGFLGRILNAISIAMVGWAVLNLPKIIFLADQLGERIGKVVKVMNSFMTNTFSIIREMGSLSATLLRDLATFDFSEMGRQVDDSLSKVKTSFNRMENDFRESLQELVKPFDFGEEKEEKPPSEQPPAGGQPPAEQSPTGTGGGVEAKWKPLLNLIASGESAGGGYSAMYPSESHPQILNMTIAQVIQFQKQKLKDGRKSAAIGRYQMLYPENYAAAAGLPLTAKFSPENQDKMAIAYLKKNRKLSKWEQGKISDEELSEELAREFGALKSASGYVLPGNTGSVGFDQLKPVLQKIKKQPAQTTTAPPPAQATPLPSGFDPNKRYKVGETVATGAEVGAEVSSRRGWRWGTMHGGIDVTMPVGTVISCRYECIIKEARSQSGYGHYVDVVIPALSVRIRLAHLTAGAYFFKGAPSGINSLSINYPAGKPLVRSGNTGRSTGPHVHLEATKNLDGVGYGGSDPNYLEPDPYVDAFIFTTNAPTGVVTQPASTSVSGTRRGVTSADSITPETKDKTIVVTAPASGNRSSMASASSDSSPTIIIGDGLNSLIKQRILLELAYT